MKIDIKIRTGKERVVTYEGINYYIDLQGRVYRSTGRGYFIMPQIKNKKILHGISNLPEIQIAMKELKDYLNTLKEILKFKSRKLKTAPQPIKHFLS